MCRSALEYPPNGKRCGKQEHWTQEERDAWRVKRNAYEKARYHARKALKPQKPVDTTPTVTPPAVNMVREDRNYEILDTAETRILYSDISEKDTHYTQEQWGKIERVLSGTQPGLAYLKITGDDKNFHNDDAGYTNDVRRVFLEDGTVGYFKGYTGSIYMDGDENLETYGHTVAGSMLNEVAAYQLVQALGGEFKGLVPETVITEYNNDVGTLQREAPGRVRPYMQSGVRFNVDEYRRAAVLDFLMCSQDRHTENFTVENMPDYTVAPRLIDNGFAFTETTKPYINASVIIDKAYSLGDDGIFLTSSESRAVASLHANPEVMKPYMSKKAYTLFLNRLNHLHTEGAFTGYVGEDNGRKWW